MFKKLNKKGFTLAELLIVVAIIGVLVAVSIPIFTSQLHKAQDATDLANIRSYYAELQSAAITDGVDSSKLVTTKTDTITLQTGEVINLKNMKYTVSKNSEGNGYVITYECNDGAKCKAGHTAAATFGGTAKTGGSGTPAGGDETTGG